MSKKEIVKAVSTLLIGVLAVVNLVLVSCGKTIVTDNASLEACVSALVALAMTAYNTWKNRNITTAAQKGQQITDLIKDGSLTVNEVSAFLDKFEVKER